MGNVGFAAHFAEHEFQAVPAGIDIEEVRAYLESLPGVKAIHDLHIWSMSTTEVALTGHLVIPGEHPGDAFLMATCTALKDRFGIGHATLQIEISEMTVCALEPNHVV